MSNLDSQNVFIENQGGVVTHTHPAFALIKVTPIQIDDGINLHNEKSIKKQVLSFQVYQAKVVVDGLIAKNVPTELIYQGILSHSEYQKFISGKGFITHDKKLEDENVNIKVPHIKKVDPDSEHPLTDNSPLNDVIGGLEASVAMIKEAKGKKAVRASIQAYRDQISSAKAVIADLDQKTQQYVADKKEQNFNHIQASIQNTMHSLFSLDSENNLISNSNK
ncbi:hypothetical protein [Acinetobacter sp. P1(2025)]|uniref:hypothetical protein n=1 Tax=Acinetobacter sp. P1(2025) TaxID=3446120 RepID=UPI003F52937B